MSSNASASRAAILLQSSSSEGSTVISPGAGHSHSPRRPMLQFPDPFDETTLQFVYTHLLEIRYVLAGHAGCKRMRPAMRRTLKQRRQTAVDTTGDQP